MLRCQPDGSLTAEQLKFYDLKGYILVRNNVSHDLLNKLCDHFVNICNGHVHKGFLSTMKDQHLKQKGAKGEFLINKIQDWLYDDVLFEYAQNEVIVKVISSIIGPNITAVHSMLINKPPEAAPEGSLHPMHQDLHYFPFRPADQIVASWTAMERVDERNGCLYVVEGSHKGGLYKHEYPKGYKNRMYHGVSDFDYLPRKYVAMEKGDTIFFHPLLLHGSGPNLTKGFRKAISVHFANSNCHFIDVMGTTQENIAKEIEELGAKFAGGIRLNIEHIWKAKSRLVAGEPGNFQRLDSHL